MGSNLLCFLLTCKQELELEIFFFPSGCNIYIVLETLCSDLCVCKLTLMGIYISEKKFSSGVCSEESYQAWGLFLCCAALLCFSCSSVPVLSCWHDLGTVTYVLLESSRWRQPPGLHVPYRSTPLFSEGLISLTTEYLSIKCCLSLVKKQDSEPKFLLLSRSYYGFLSHSSLFLPSTHEILFLIWWVE